MTSTAATVAGAGAEAGAGAGVGEGRGRRVSSYLVQALHVAAGVGGGHAVGDTGRVRLHRDHVEPVHDGHHRRPGALLVLREHTGGRAGQGQVSSGARLRQTTLNWGICVTGPFIAVQTILNRGEWKS